MNFALKQRMQFILFQFCLVILDLMLYFLIGFLNGIFVEAGLKELVEAFEDG